jgi:hypothetical protein
MNRARCIARTGPVAGSSWCPCRRCSGPAGLRRSHTQMSLQRVEWRRGEEVKGGREKGTWIVHMSYFRLDKALHQARSGGLISQVKYFIPQFRREFDLWLIASNAIRKPDHGEQIGKRENSVQFFRRVPKAEVWMANDGAIRGYAICPA